MSEYTPGPWYVKRNGVRSPVNSEDGRHIAMINYSPMTIPDEMHEANARLIVAAPDLLEALRAIYKEAFSENDPDHCHHCHTRVGAHEPWCAAGIARAAIDKAEGR